jgi:hypothetical protein
MDREFDGDFWGAYAFAYANLFRAGPMLLPPYATAGVWVEQAISITHPAKRVGFYFAEMAAGARRISLRLFSLRL